MVAKLLNLRPEPTPIIIERIVREKKLWWMEVLKMAVVIVVVSSVVYGVSRAAEGVPKNKSNIQKLMQTQVSKLEDFLAHIPSELSLEDQNVLTKEIQEAITAISSKSTTPSLAVSTSTLKAKKGTATSTRLTKEERQQLASSTEAARKERQKNRQTEVKNDSVNFMLLSMKIQSINQLLRPQQNKFEGKQAKSIFSKLNISTTPVSSDVLHTIVVANSASTIQTIMKDIRESRMAELRSLIKERMKEKQKEMADKRLLKKLEKKAKTATTTPEVATSTEPVATTTNEVATTTSDIATSTPSGTSVLDTATSTDTTATSTETVATSTPVIDISTTPEQNATTTQEVATSTPGQATTTPEVVSIPDETATTTTEVTPEIVPEVVPEPEPVVEVPVADPAPTEPASEVQP